MEVSPPPTRQNVSAKANQLANFPLNFLRTGYYSYSDGKIHNRTAGGGWWSTTRLSATLANFLNVNASNVYPQNNNQYGFGFALRCGGLPTTNETNVPAKANQLANFPLNFLRTGNYGYTEGKMQARMIGGRWWSSTRSDAAKANYLTTSTDNVYPQYSYDYGIGFAMRCVAGCFLWGIIKHNNLDEFSIAVV